MTTPYKILFVGDSITAERKFVNPPLIVYSEQVGANLPALYPTLDFGGYTTGLNTYADKGIVNHGYGGWATDGYTQDPTKGFLYGTNLQTYILNENADIVFIMLGTNDHWSYDGINIAIPLVDYQANLEYIVDQILATKPATKIVLMSPPPLVDDPAAPLYNASNARVATYAAAVEAVTVSKSVNFLDIYTILWNLSGNSQTTLNSTYLLDGVHLNQAGQDVIYTNVLAELVTLIVPPVFFTQIAGIQKTATGWRPIFPQAMTVDGVVNVDVGVMLNV